MADSTDQVILIGAGIGGLFAALCLHQVDIKCVLLEKAPELSEVGAGIQIGANGSRLIHQLGLQDVVQKYAMSPARGQIMDGRTGQLICPYPLNESSLERYQFPYYQIHRGDLQRLLVDAVEKRMPGCIRLGTELVEIYQDADSIQVTTNSGERISGAALVGCDGIHSATRKLLFDDGPAQYTGCNAWRAVVPISQMAETQDWQVPKIWIGAGRHLVQYPVCSGQAVNLVACVEDINPAPEHWQGHSSAVELAAAFATWCPEVNAMLEQAGEALKWGLYERPVLSRWSVGRATLLGDAAHAMLPSLAQGAVMAMEDAEALAIALSGEGDTVRALQDYEKKRISRSRKVQKVARDNLSFFHQSTGFKDRISLKALSILGQKSESIIANRYSWLYGYCGASGASSNSI